VDCAATNRMCSCSIHCRVFAHQLRLRSGRRRSCITGDQATRHTTACPAPDGLHPQIPSVRVSDSSLSVRDSCLDAPRRCLDGDRGTMLIAWASMARKRWPSWGVERHLEGENGRHRVLKDESDAAYSKSTRSLGMISLWWDQSR